MRNPPYISDQKRVNTIRRHQRPPVWRQPRLWFWFIIASFSFNLLIAVLTIERNASFSTSKTSSFEIDRPAILPISRLRKEQPKAHFLEESPIWHRMLLQEKERPNYFICNGKNKKSDANDGFADESEEIHLAPFGYRNAVRKYVQEHEGWANQSSKEIFKSSSSSRYYCLAPPSEPACQSFQYTVVMYSSSTNWNSDQVHKESNYSTGFSYQPPNNDNGYWRKIVVGAMKFLAYPSVQRLNLVLREHESQHNNEIPFSSRINDVGRRRIMLQDAAKRNKYAKRVLEWNRKGIVNVVITPSLWDAIDRLEVPSDSVLWIDGDVSSSFQGSNVANGTVLNHRFRAWRELPNALVIPKESSILPLPQSKSNIQYSENNNSHLPCTFPLIHEMMIHTNYLCYLNHELSAELRNYTDSVHRGERADESVQKVKRDALSSWDATLIAMGMLLFSIGDGYIVGEADHSSAGAASHKLLPLSSEPDDMHILKTEKEVISNYFGCPCPLATRRLSSSSARQCTSEQSPP